MRFVAFRTLKGACAGFMPLDKFREGWFSFMVNGGTVVEFDAPSTASVDELRELALDACRR